MKVGEAYVSASEAMQGAIYVQIRLKGLPWWRLKFSVGVWLMKLGLRIAGVGADISFKEPDEQTRS